MENSCHKIVPWKSVYHQENDVHAFHEPLKLGYINPFLIQLSPFYQICHQPIFFFKNKGIILGANNDKEPKIKKIN